MASICMFKTLPKTFSILVSTSVWYSPSEGQMHPLKAICDFSIEAQDTSLYQKQGNTPIPSQEESYISKYVCIKQPANYIVGFYFEDTYRSATYLLALHWELIKLTTVNHKGGV